MTDDLPFTAGPDRPSVSQPRKCRRHMWMVEQQTGHTSCHWCGKHYDDATTRRGRNNRARGNAIEREVGHRLGLRRVGQFGGPDDLSGDLFSVQVKSGGAFPERLWSWLKAVPANAGQTPLLVVTDASGPGRRRRAVVVLDLDEWIALHGPTEGAA